MCRLFGSIVIFTVLILPTSTLATSCEELTHWKRLWCWEGLGAGGEGDDRYVWMASLTRWTRVWVNSGSWWWTGRPGVLQFMGRKESDTTERLNWTELIGPQGFITLEFSIIKHHNFKRSESTQMPIKRKEVQKTRVYPSNGRVCRCKKSKNVLYILMWNDRQDELLNEKSKMQKGVGHMLSFV